MPPSRRSRSGTGAPGRRTPRKPGENATFLRVGHGARGKADAPGAARAKAEKRDLGISGRRREACRAGESAGGAQRALPVDSWRFRGVSLAPLLSAAHFESRLRPHRKRPANTPVRLPSAKGRGRRLPPLRTFAPQTPKRQEAKAVPLLFLTVSRSAKSRGATHRSSPRARPERGAQRPDWERRHAQRPAAAERAFPSENPAFHEPLAASAQRQERPACRSLRPVAIHRIGGREALLCATEGRSSNEETNRRRHGTQSARSRLPTSDAAVPSAPRLPAEQQRRVADDEHRPHVVRERPEHGAEQAEHGADGREDVERHGERDVELDRRERPA